MAMYKTIIACIHTHHDSQQIPLADVALTVCSLHAFSVQCKKKTTWQPGMPLAEPILSNVYTVVAVISVKLTAYICCVFYCTCRLHSDQREHVSIGTRTRAIGSDDLESVSSPRSEIVVGYGQHDPLQQTTSNDPLIFGTLSYTL